MSNQVAARRTMAMASVSQCSIINFIANEHGR